ncbi:non-ribosomal peptide synthetase [Pseudoalteromonas rhizosphaerae]|uniref:Amino acid adenylation domain-containing protein n=1 Tax=Pseudoalteromonas rhizosphaerae TaxID=2518973 RepID=A0ABW8L1C9_9GAMM
MSLNEVIDSCVTANVKLSIIDERLDVKAPSGALTPELVLQLKAHKDELMTWLKAQADTSGQEKSVIIRAPVMDDYPLSSNQLRLWFIEQAEQGSTVYNIPAQMKLTGNLDTTCLKLAIQATVERHEILRTLYQVRDEQPRQVVLSQVSVPFFYHDLSIEGENAEVKRNEILQQAFAFRFDLANDISIRLTVIKESDQVYTLAFLVHHIAADAWSIGLITKEILFHYEHLIDDCMKSKMMDVELQYKDYTHWQQARTQEYIGSSPTMDFWQQYLAGSSGYLPIHTDFPRKASAALTAGCIEKPMDQANYETLRQFCNANGVSMFVTLELVYSIVLSIYAGTQDVTIGFPIANRPHKELENIVGYFSNTLVMRNQIDYELNFLALLEQAKNDMADILSYQDIPFDLLVEQLNIPRVSGAHPLFQHSFVLQEKVPDLTTQQYGVAVELESPGTNAAKFDLMLQFCEVGEQMMCSWEFDRRLFKHETITEMKENFDFLLTQLLAAPVQPLKEVVNVCQTQRNDYQQFIGQFAPYDQKILITDRIDQWAVSNPTAPALADIHSNHSYAQLSRQSDLLALILIEHGLNTGERVGICIPRSADFMVWVCAVLKAGLAYVPIDESYPNERISAIIDSAQTVAIILTANLSNICEGMASPPLILDSDEVIASLPQPSEVFNKPEILVQRRQDIYAASQAYLIFTSGTTGKPKGVSVSHGALLNLVENQKRIFSVTSDSKMISFSSVSFDISVADWAWALAHGASLYLCDEPVKSDPIALSECLVDKGITHLNVTPSVLSLIDSSREYQFKAITVGGEAPSTSVMSKWCLQYPVFNTYGPTESAVYMLYARITDASYIYLNTTFDNVFVYVLNQHFMSVPKGCVGELFIGGASLACGYFNNPDETAQKFIHVPTIHNGPLYRTGDLVKLDDNGNLIFQGRCDDQVKIRGNRLEIREVETCLEQHALVSEAVVVKKEAPNGMEYLLALINPTCVGEQEFSTILTQYLIEKLPSYMVPAQFSLIEDWPVNLNGKTDRKALSQLEFTFSATEYQPPRGEVDRRLCGIWAELLECELEDISVNSNFYALNGNSILLMKMLGLIKQEFKINLSLKDIVDAKSLAELSDSVQLILNYSVVKDTLNTDEFEMEGEI